MHAVVVGPDYLPGDKVEFELIVENVTAERLTIRSFPPALDIIGPREPVIVYSFPEGMASLSLGPGEEAAQNFVWNQVDTTGKPVQAGHYKLGVPTIRFAENNAAMGWSSQSHDSIFVRHAGGELIRTVVPGRAGMSEACLSCSTAWSSTPTPPRCASGQSRAWVRLS